MIIQWLKGYAPGAWPWKTRATYYQEMRASVSLPFVQAMCEGSLLSILAKQAFNCSSAIVYALFLMPFAANTTSLLWAQWIHGRHKTKSCKHLLLALSMGVMLLALPPSSWWQHEISHIFLVCYLFMMRALLAGFITVRSHVWRANYPNGCRAKMTSYFILNGHLLTAAVPIVTFWLLDIVNVEIYRCLFLAAGVSGLFAAHSYSQIRLHGEAKLQSQEEAKGRASFMGGWRVLKEDKKFAYYMCCQFLAGVGNICSLALFQDWAQEWVNQDFSDIKYVVSGLLTLSLPLIASAVSLPLWANYLDRVHIAHFRTRHGLLWLLCIPGYGIAFMMQWFWLLVLMRILHGVAAGGGGVAWNLGHNDFALLEETANYMGVHVFLTGVRGVLCFVLASYLVFMGHYAFWVCGGFCLLAYLGFWGLHLHIKRQQKN